MFANRHVISGSGELDKFWKTGRDIRLVNGDPTTILQNNYAKNNRMPASTNNDSSIEKQELYLKLIKLSPIEKGHYNGIEQYMKNITEKIYYLDLTPQERYEYRQAIIQQNNQGNVNNPNTWNLGRKGMNYPMSRIHYMGNIENFHQYAKPGRIVLNMSKSEVIHLWGRPDRKDIAGNPANQNERWIFNNKDGIREVFFEQGRVNGWKIPY